MTAWIAEWLEAFMEERQDVLDERDCIVLGQIAGVMRRATDRTIGQEGDR